MLWRRTSILFVLVSSLALGYRQGVSSFDVIHWSTFQKGSYSKIKGPYRIVINNEAELQSYWVRAMGEAPGAAPRGVDWLKEELIAIHIGERNTGGFSVEVDSIKRTHAAEVTVEFAEVTPSRGSSNTQVITSPWVIIRMDRTAGNLQFHQTSRTNQTGILVRGGRGCGCCRECTCSVGPVEEITAAHRELGTNFDPEVWWKVFDQGRNSNIPTYGWLVIRSLNELNAYVMRNTGSDRDLFGEDPVDWKRDQLVAFNLGIMPSSGYRMAVDSLERTGVHVVTIRYTVIYPGQQQPFLAKLASPWVMIRTDRATDSYVLVRRNFLPTIDGGYGCSCRCARCLMHR